MTLRVGIDIRTADPREPGQQRYLWRLGQWLSERGHDLHYLTVRPQPGEVDAGEATLHRLHDASRVDLRASVRDLELDVLMLNPERSRRYRGVGANFLRSAYGTEHYRQKLRSFRSPAERAVRSLERVLPWVVAERGWERSFYQSDAAPQVVAQSEYMKKEIVSSYGVPDARIEVVHNAVDRSEFSPPARERHRDEARERWGIGPDETCFLFLGHNFRLKGLWPLLDVLEELDGATHLLVVGRGTGAGQRRKAARRIERLGGHARATLAGVVHPPLLAYAAADALVHLSWHDSFGFAVLEAMACGLPVLTTDHVGAAELLERGVSGLVVDPGRPRAVGAALRTLLDPTLRSAIGQSASSASAAYDEPSNFARIEAAMRRAAERTGRAIR